MTHKDKEGYLYTTFDTARYRHYFRVTPCCLVGVYLNKTTGLPVCRKCLKEVDPKIALKVEIDFPPGTVIVSQ